MLEAGITPQRHDSDIYSKLADPTPPSAISRKDPAMSLRNCFGCIHKRKSKSSSEENDAYGLRDEAAKQQGGGAEGLPGSEQVEVVDEQIVEPEDIWQLQQQAPGKRHHRKKKRSVWIFTFSSNITLHVL